MQSSRWDPWGPGLALLLLLLLLPSCVVPPPEEEPIPNKPPTLEWKLTEPQGSWVIFARSVDSTVSFSVASAVRDPEGDQLYFVWYWRVPGSNPNPAENGWNENMTLSPCDSWQSLRTAKTVQVTVVISDRFIQYDRNEDPAFPVAYDEETPPLVREWTIEMVGACVN